MAISRREFIHLIPPMVTASFLVACGRGGSPNTESPTANPPPTDTPKPLDVRDRWGIQISGPHAYPEGNRYALFFDDLPEGQTQNSGRIANALAETFNPNADPNFVRSVAQQLRTNYPQYFSSTPNSYGNFDIRNPYEGEYILLDESVIEAVRTAPTAPPPPTATPDYAATRIQATVNSVYIDQAAAATGTAMAQPPR